MKKTAIICSVVMLGALTALAGTISVPQFNDGGGDTDSGFFPPSNSATFITLHNNTAVAQEYTILYYSGTGANRTPAVNTFSIGGNASIGWRPVSTTDANEGAGAAVPNATGAGGNGSATILYADTIDPSGRVFVNVAASLSSYAFALFPAQ